MSKMPQLLLAAWAAAALVLSSSASAQDKVQSLRGDVPIEATSKADMFRVERDSPPIQRDFVQQPPLIPHTVKGYTITRNFNKCMDCHAWSRVKETGATKVSLTHFKDRSTGAELANISPSRYFCTQCHVPQYDAKPLVANEFKPVDALVAPAGRK
jgi:cytochrome c-type protein NapB